MAVTWEQIINLILNGEDVDAAVTNRPTSQLSARTQYLYDRLVATAIGEALYIHDVPVEDDAVVGDTMYYDDTASEYKRAIAAVELDTEFGWYAPTKSSYAIGILVSKSAVGLGSICTAGALRNFDLSNAVEPGTPTTAGALYLSMTVPGKVTLQKPPVGIYIAYNRGDSVVHVMPTPKDMLEDHIHHRHELVAAPAGDANCITYGSGEVHEVIDPDPAQQGWLPASHPVFNGLAPEGAHFGYNIAQQEDLLKVWPPQPLDSGYIEVNRGNGYVGLRLRGTCPDVIINAQGIWWMNNCYGSAPWAPDYECNSSSSGSSESSESCDIDCQTPLEYLPGNLDPDRMYLALWFTKMVFKTDASVVTSLQPDGDNSPITINDCDGEAATTGQLFAGLDLSKLAIAEPVAGFKVIKSFAANKLNRGPAITGIKAGTGAAIVGIGEEGTDWQVSAAGVYAGNVQVGLLDQLNDPRDFVPNLVSVNNVREEYDNVSKFFYLAYPAGRASECRYSAEIPLIGMPTVAIRAYLWFWFVGRSAGAVPKLVASYRRYPKAVATPAALPSSDTDIVSGGWTPGLSLVGGDYAYAATPWFDVAVGDTIFYTIGWDGVPGPTDGFGIMRAALHTEIKP